jgi:hypothetical protein
MGKMTKADLLNFYKKFAMQEELPYCKGIERLSLEEVQMCVEGTVKKKHMDMFIKEAHEALSKLRKSIAPRPMSGQDFEDEVRHIAKSHGEELVEVLDRLRMGQDREDATVSVYHDLKEVIDSDLSFDPKSDEPYFDDMYVEDVADNTARFALNYWDD